MWYAGTNWADDAYDAVVTDKQGQRVASCRGTQTAARLARILETPHGLLMAALMEAGLAVYPVNPKTVERRCKPSGPKTDAIDAHPLAKLGAALSHTCALAIRW